MLQRDQNEISELIQNAAAGDQSAFEALLKSYSPLLDSMSATFAEALGDSASREDLRQEACIAFYRAVESFDTAQEHVQFGLYAKTCIRNRLISCLRTMRPQEVSVPPEKLPLGGSTRDPGVSFVEKEDYLALARQIKSLLSPYENRVWWLYLSGLTAGSIAERLQKDERSIQNAIYRIRKKLRDALSAQ